MKSNKKGFTLLEVLIALIMTAILILAINKAIYTVKKGNAISEQFFQVISYSHNVLEYFKSNQIDLKEGEYSPEEIIDENIYEFIKKGYESEIYKKSLIKIKKVHSSSDQEDEVFSVRLLVTWKGVAGEKNYKISTYIYQS